jgi:hypothetical protein
MSQEQAENYWLAARERELIRRAIATEIRAIRTAWPYRANNRRNERIPRKGDPERIAELRAIMQRLV